VVIASLQICLKTYITEHQSCWCMNHCVATQALI